ncbi:MAG: antitoxin VbhA family protein [Lachnospiraceae bacterium]|nr:antitoxin VbhA family protein [Lachnospiraceae bacterium]
MTNSQAWDYAIGMIRVDGLEPTAEFMAYIEKEKRGEVTMEDAKMFLDKKYKMKEPFNA